MGLDTIDEQKLSFLTNMMNQNIDHARHVETERLTFVSFQLMGFGLLLSDSNLITGDKRLAILLVCVLLGLNIICSFLLYRWADVFKRHMAIAQKMRDEILNIIKLNSSLGSSLANKYFLFENQKCYRDDWKLEVDGFDYEQIKKRERKEVCKKRKNKWFNKLFVKLFKSEKNVDCEDGLNCYKLRWPYFSTAKLFGFFNVLMYVLLIGLVIFICFR